jgi:hypothetical protein
MHFYDTLQLILFSRSPLINDFFLFEYLNFTFSLHLVTQWIYFSYSHSTRRYLIFIVFSFHSIYTLCMYSLIELIFLEFLI